MVNVKVHAGDFLKDAGQFSFGSRVLKTDAHAHYRLGNSDYSLGDS